MASTSPGHSAGFSTGNRGRPPTSIEKTPQQKGEGRLHSLFTGMQNGCLSVYSNLSNMPASVRWGSTAIALYTAKASLIPRITKMALPTFRSYPVTTTVILSGAAVYGAKMALMTLSQNYPGTTFVVCSGIPILAAATVYATQKLVQAVRDRYKTARIWTDTHPRLAGTLATVGLLGIGYVPELARRVFQLFTLRRLSTVAACGIVAKIGFICWQTLQNRLQNFQDCLLALREGYQSLESRLKALEDRLQASNALLTLFLNALKTGILDEETPVTAGALTKSCEQSIVETADQLTREKLKLLLTSVCDHMKTHGRQIQALQEQLAQQPPVHTTEESPHIVIN